jgi:hypothetical protein
MQAFINFPEGPKEIEVTVLTPNKQIIGKQFKKGVSDLLQYLLYLYVLDGAVIISFLESCKEVEKINEIQECIKNSGLLDCFLIR